MSIKCIIVDDEPLARKGLKEYIADAGFLELIGEYDNALKTTAILSEGGVQLLFLDIQMPKITGMEFFRTLKNPPPVIFTTAYPQYAIEGFEVNALDYLVKPISFERFMKTAVKAKEFYEVREKNAVDLPASADYFFIKADNKLIKLHYDEILFAEALQNYVAVHTLSKKHITYLTFRSIEEHLPASRFIRTHKSYIVSAAKVESIEGNDIKIGQHHIPISRTERDAVLQQLLQNRLLKR